MHTKVVIVHYPANQNKKWVKIIIKWRPLHIPISHHLMLLKLIAFLDYAENNYQPTSCILHPIITILLLLLILNIIIIILDIIIIIIIQRLPQLSTRFFQQIIFKYEEAIYLAIFYCCYPQTAVILIWLL